MKKTNLEKFRLTFEYDKPLKVIRKELKQRQKGTNDAGNETFERQSYSKNWKDGLSDETN